MSPHKQWLEHDFIGLAANHSSCTTQLLAGSAIQERGILEPVAERQIAQKYSDLDDARRDFLCNTAAPKHLDDAPPAAAQNR